MNIPPQKPWESGGGNAIGNSRLVGFMFIFT